MENKNNTKNLELIKNLDWFMPGKIPASSVAKSSKSAELFKCCRMRVYYPESYHHAQVRKPLIQSMTLHLGSDVHRYFTDTSKDVSQVFQNEFAWV